MMHVTGKCRLPWRLIEERVKIVIEVYLSAGHVITGSSPSVHFSYFKQNAYTGNDSNSRTAGNNY